MCSLGPQRKGGGRMGVHPTSPILCTNSATKRCLLALCHPPMTFVQRIASLHVPRVPGPNLAFAFACAAAARVDGAAPHPLHTLIISPAFDTKSRAPRASKAAPPLQIIVITNPQQHGGIAVGSRRQGNQMAGGDALPLVFSSPLYALKNPFVSRRGPG